MSIFTYVFCVLLVATATTAADDEFDLNLTTATIAEVHNAVLKDYWATRRIVDKVFMTMKLRIPPEMDSWPRKGKKLSATCFEFLKNGIEAHRSLVEKCSSPHLPTTRAIDIIRNDLDMALAPLRMRINKPKDAAEFCELWFYTMPVRADRIALCKNVVDGGVPAMIERARGKFNTIVNQVTDVANNWVFRAGYFCLVKPNVGYTGADWSAACRKA